MSKIHDRDQEMIEKSVTKICSVLSNVELDQLPARNFPELIDQIMSTICIEFSLSNGNYLVLNGRNPSLSDEFTDRIRRMNLAENPSDEDLEAYVYASIAGRVLQELISGLTSVGKKFTVLTILQTALRDPKDCKDPAQPPNFTTELRMKANELAKVVISSIMASAKTAVESLK